MSFSKRPAKVKGPNKAYSASRSYDTNEDPAPAPEPTPILVRIVESDSAAKDDISPPDDQDKSKDADRVKSDDFYAAWDRFIIAQPKRARRAQRAAKVLDQEKKLVENAQPEGLHFKVNAAQSWEDAANECRLKVAAIVEECKRLNQKYRDALFDLDDSYNCVQGLGSDSLTDGVEQPPWIKRVGDIFEKPQFFVNSDTTADIHQGRLGDCWFLSALTSVSADKRILEKLCVAKDEFIGVYGFVFYRDGEWIHEVIDDKLYIRVGDDDDLDIVANFTPSDDWPVTIRHDKDKLKEQLQKGGEALFFSHSKADETWIPLIEKAYAKAHGDYSSIDGGWPSEGIEDITGGVATNINPEDIMDKDKFWYEQLRQVNKKYLFNCSTGWTSKKGLAGGHAYTILETWDEGELKLVKVRNPWGEYEWKEDWSDGSKQWTPDMMKKLNHTFGDDGVFWISYKDLLKNFPSLYRVRLFDHEWQISQRWTCVNVPWTVDYMDTKFEIEVTTTGPLVIVLAQPDERYFRGLAGRFDYALHFRLYRAGETGHKYLVRSMHSSGGSERYTRSVSAELEDVEPGKYFVIFKVIANRAEFKQRAEEAIMEFATSRKEKLTAVGRRFDFAQTKGNLRAFEKAERRKKRTENYERAIQGMRRLRKSNKLERQRDRLRKKRRDDAMTAQRKAIFERDAEKRKLRRAEEQSVATPKIIVGKDQTTVKPDEQKAVPPGEQGDASPGTAATSGSSQTILTPASTEGSAAEKAFDSAGPTASDPIVEQATSDVAKLTVSDAITDSKPLPATELPESQPPTAVTSAAPVVEAAASQPAAPAAIGTAAQLPAEDVPWEDPPEQADELDDDDFSWDSEMDGPLNSDTSSRSTEAGRDIDIFEDDPWHAVCVIGLRVYSKGSNVQIEVRNATEEAEDDVEVV